MALKAAQKELEKLQKELTDAKAADEYTNAQADKTKYEAKATKGKPTAIIAKTVKGKGVSFMENQASWHGTAPNDEQYAQAMEELEKAGESLCQK